MDYIEIDKLNLKAGTQHRVLNHIKVTEYAELMKDGIELPPVEVVQEGMQYILVDGFHRVQAAIENDSDMISANIKKGTLRDAIWASLATNKHGLPAGPEEIARKIEIALTDKAWKDKSLREIANHISCHHEKVRRVKKKLEEQNKAKEEPEKLTEIDTSHMPMTTQSGQDIPSEMEEIFNIRGDLDKIATSINDISSRVSGYQGLPGADCLNITEINRLLLQARKLVRAAKPFDLCPLCTELNRDTCQLCNGLGWVTQKQFKNATR